MPVLTYQFKQYKHLHLYPKLSKLAIKILCNVIHFFVATSSSLIIIFVASYKGDSQCEDWVSSEVDFSSFVIHSVANYTCLLIC